MPASPRRRSPFPPHRGRPRPLQHTAAAAFSRILGTEEDKVNCPFYYKIGACRHGERCSRVHLKPKFSQSIMIPHMYVAPQTTDADGKPIKDAERIEREAFEDFYEEVVEELVKFGRVLDVMIVNNLGAHMFGNLYVKYADEEDAERALKALTGRYYAGRMLAPEYTPVTDFREARCGMYEEGACNRGDYCNFIHAFKVPRYLRNLHREHKRGRNSRGQSRSPSHSRGRSKSRSRSRSQSPASEAGNKPVETDAERRARIAAWNAARKKQQQMNQQQDDAADAFQAPS